MTTEDQLREAFAEHAASRPVPGAADTIELNDRLQATDRAARRRVLAAAIVAIGLLKVVALVWWIRRRRARQD